MLDQTTPPKDQLIFSKQFLLNEPSRENLKYDYVTKITIGSKVKAMLSEFPLEKLLIQILSLIYEFPMPRVAPTCALRYLTHEISNRRLAWRLINTFIIWTVCQRHIQAGKNVSKTSDYHFCLIVKIGVVGVNGAGKSTLMKIMAGLDKEFTGEAWAAEGAKVGYLPGTPFGRPPHSA